LLADARGRAAGEVLTLTSTPDQGATVNRSLDACGNVIDGESGMDDWEIEPEVGCGPVMTTASLPEEQPLTCNWDCFSYTTVDELPLCSLCPPASRTYCDTYEVRCPNGQRVLTPVPSCERC
jgi:hypothetical protein